MVRLVSFILFITVGTLSGQAGEVRYYRSERSFLSGVEISESDLGFRSYIQVRYDTTGKLVRKAFYKRRNRLDRFETFQYGTTTGRLQLKSLFSADSSLQKYTRFGADEIMSDKFIRYTYGVSTVQDYDDRFTSIEYRSDEKPQVYRFYDVDGFMYGVIELKYDDDDHVRQEDWVVMPSKKVVRRYVKNFDIRSGETDVWEYDSTLTVVNKMTIDSDGFAPIITLFSPEEGLPFNEPRLSYHLKEDIAKGTVTWEWAGGKADTLSPHMVDLIPSERTRGDHQNKLLRYAPQLQDSASYKINFSGVGESGYPAREILLTQVPYDTTPPVYTADAPQYSNRPVISFSLDEALSTAEVVWVWERGVRDENAPHIIGLSRGMLEAGEQDSVILGDDIQLAERTVYKVLFQGKDIAGNPGPFLTIEDVIYDTTRPEIDWRSPDSSGFASSSVVGFVSSEDLMEAQIRWEHVGGVPDDGAPYTVVLEGTELDGGEHLYESLANSPQLVDGSIYNITMKGKDLAGNVAPSLEVPNIVYDTSPPTLATIAPEPGISIRDGAVIYNLSEDFASAEVDWVLESAEASDSRNISIKIPDEGLASGDHRLDDSTFVERLTDGGLFTIQLTGRDRAGNEAVPSSISNVKFDITAPEFADITPSDCTFVMSPHVNYTLTENLSEGTVIWTQVAGEIDLSSPQMMTLPTNELTIGVHDSVMAPVAPSLQDGSIYVVSFMGVDPAGNRSLGASATDVMYDITPPEIVFTFPDTGSHMPTTAITYTSSERLSRGQVTWEWVDGKLDVKAPHITSLEVAELSKGAHESFVLAKTPTLVSGGVYEVTIEGTDLSGKSSEPKVAARVTFDDTPPEVLFTSPSSDAYRNRPAIGYELSEALSSASVIWQRTDGEEDVSSPHVVALESLELSGGPHADSLLTNDPFLKDGAVYDVQMVGIDSAGNVSDTVSVTGIIYDTTPPELIVSYPIASTPTRNYDVAYSVSENLKSGEVIWEWSGGESDSAGRHVQPLSGDELVAGDHERATIINSPPGLVEGAVYSVTVNVMDLASNGSVPMLVENVIYDATAPVFAQVSPDSGDYVNSTGITYHISETILSGAVIWESNSPEMDTSRHIVEFEGDELKSGLHETIIMANAPDQLVDGALYTLKIAGSDAALNNSDTVIVAQITYDAQPPVVELPDPVADTFVSSTMLSYEFSESMSSATAQWEHTGGSRDRDSLHVVDFVPNELTEGEHPETIFFNEPKLVEGGIYRLTVTGTDLAGNISEPIVIANLTFDATAPIFADVVPAVDSYVNAPLVGYWLSENLSDGSLTWQQIGGVEDPNSPHVSTLTGQELNSGTHAPGRLTETPELVDGATYAVSMAGHDPAGNLSETVQIDSVHYDITNPVIVMENPLTGSYVNTPNIIYNLSEVMAEGSITFQRTAGGADPSSPHTVTIPQVQLKMGQHASLDSTVWPDLSDGSVYRVTYTGIDRAGNEAEPVVLDGIGYDITLPVISTLMPSDSSAVNHTRFSYNLSEQVVEGTVTWTWLAGPEDSGSPHSINLAEDKMGEGSSEEVELGEPPLLVDGAEYSIELIGKDAAGNWSDVARVSNLRYDVTPPTFAVTFPTTDLYVLDSRVAYDLSEPLAEGSVTWAQTSGAADSRSPHLLQLTGEELTTEQYDTLLSSIPPLTDGAVYSITFGGTDAAGNEAEKVTVNEIKVDYTAPVLTLTSPVSGSAIKNSAIAYTLSENLKDASMLWTYVEGPNDPSSPHTVPLDSEELTLGDHPEGELIFPPLLVDGGLYNLAFVGVDYAGNVSDTVQVEELRYDVTPPVIVLTDPMPDAFLNNILPSYSLSEQMLEASFVWTRTGGLDDAASPHTSELTENELSSGEHLETALMNLPALVDGAIYTVTFNGKDMANNDAEEVVIERIAYDVTLPVIAVSGPESDIYIDEPFISLSLSEDLASGQIVWRDSRNSANSQTMTISGDLSTIGEHLEVNLSDSITLTDGTIYSLLVTGMDRAGNEATPVSINNIGFDTSPPTLAITSPAMGDYINSPGLTFNLSENLKEGVITWLRTGGVADSSPPREINLSTVALTAGDHPDFLFPDMASLVSGAIYSVTISGVDMAGNEGTPVTLPDLSYDDSPPTFAVNYPASNQFMNSMEVAFVLSESFGNASVTWSRVGGNNDSSSPHEIALTEAERGEGDHPRGILAQSPTLVDGAQYDIAFTGTDLAGNAADKVLLSGVTYDISPPAIAVSLPSSMSSINSGTMTYNLSEEMNEGKVVWTQVSGNTDGSSPHEISLNSSELAQGAHESVTFSTPPSLVDGAIYNVAFSGNDQAGNESEVVSLEQILFDVTPPTIVASYPTPISLVNTTVLSYNLSEILSEGTVTWSRTGGEADPSSPHEVTLSGLELMQGEHPDLLLSTPPNLMSESVYSISFSGKDPAGNSASGMVIEAVTFDNSAPVLALQVPNSAVAISSPNLNFSSNENLASGTIIYERTSGVNDPDSPHEVALTGVELSAGDRNAVTLTNSPTLVNGASYRITLKGTDAAGNAGEPVSLSGILYDAVQPVITLSSPGAESFINKLDIAYSLSEILTKATATWTQTGGNPDPQSPRIVELTVPEMGQGDRSDILTNQVMLTDGAIYTLSMAGSDAAGNEAAVVTAANINYDVTQPQFSNISPSEGYTNGRTMSYTLNETLFKGSVVFSSSGGVPDPNAPHNVPLSGNELTGGAHDNIDLTEAPELVSGASYIINFSGDDAAGNPSEALKIGPLLYDNTPPAITITGPISGSSINSSSISYELSEVLASGTVTWVPEGGSPQKKTFSGNEIEAGVHLDLTMSDSPSLADGTVYSLTFEGNDNAGNQMETVVVSDVTFDVTPPKINIDFSGSAPNKGLFIYNSPVGLTFSEDMGEVVFRWEREGGSEDPDSPHTLYVAGADLGKGEHSEVQVPGSENVLIGTSYTMFVDGKDKAGNPTKTQKVENIDIIRNLDGEWAYQGIAVILWKFTGGKDFSQGVLFGNTLSDEKPGEYAVDWSKRPFRLAIKYSDGTRRYGLFEFIGHNKLRVVSSSEKRPSSWSDGDYFEFEFRENNIP